MFVQESIIKANIVNKKIVLYFYAALAAVAGLKPPQVILKDDNHPQRGVENYYLAITTLPCYYILCTYGDVINSIDLFFDKTANPDFPFSLG